MLSALLLLASYAIPVSTPKPDFRDPAQAERHAMARTASHESGAREVAWKDLAGALTAQQRDVMARVRRLQSLPDDDPRAIALLAELRDIGEQAPGNGKLQGSHIRIPGYVVPLERARDHLQSFLLVPYYGACIHTPPPPANQIIHVTGARGPAGLRSMDTVWIEGSLQVSDARTSDGAAYRMHAAMVQRY